MIIEYQKIINLLDNTPNQPSNCRTKIWVGNDDSRGTYNRNSQIKFKASMLKPSLCNYSNAYILVKGSILVAAAAGAAANNNDKKIIFKSYTPTTDCINETNNTQVDNAKDMFIEKYQKKYKYIPAEQTENY